MSHRIRSHALQGCMSSLEHVGRVGGRPYSVAVRSVLGLRGPYAPVSYVGGMRVDRRVQRSSMKMNVNE